MTIPAAAAVAAAAVAIAAVHTRSPCGGGSRSTAGHRLSSPSRIALRMPPVAIVGASSGGPSPGTGTSAQHYAEEPGKPAWAYHPRVGVLSRGEDRPGLAAVGSPVEVLAYLSSLLGSCSGRRH